MICNSINPVFSQEDNILIGKILFYENDSLKPVYNANVYWLGKNIGTTTNNYGEFSLKKNDENKFLIISYIGFNNDTIEISNRDTIIHILSRPININEVSIIKRRKNITINNIEPIKIEKISEKELLKAACCNLSESFETNPSVDVIYNDAITGYKQIQLLGLSSSYVLLTRENIPFLKGLSSKYGLTYIPGPWINSINLNKGIGSVTNSYEGISGQIDVQLKQPDNMEKLYVNTYYNEESRIETNISFKDKINNNIKNASFLHFSNINNKLDKNDDSFIDMPLLKQYILMNKFIFDNNIGIHSEFNISGIYSNNIGGQHLFVTYYEKKDTNYKKFWGMNIKSKK